MIEFLWLFADPSGFVLGGLETLLALFQSAHVLTHDVVDTLELLFHAFDVFHRSGVLKIFLFGFYGAVEFDEVVVAGDGFESWVEVGGSEYDFGLVEEGGCDGVDESIG